MFNKTNIAFYQDVTIYFGDRYISAICIKIDNLFNSQFK